MKSNSKKYLIICSILAVISVVGYIFFTNYIAGLTDKTSALKSDIDLNQIKYFRLESLRKATENTSDQKQKITDLFVGENKAVDFIGEVESLAKASNLSYSTKSIENSDAGNLSEQNKDLLTITISTTGSWSNTIKFIRLIETLPYSVRVESLDLTSAGYPSASSEASVQSAEPTSTPSVVSSKWTSTIKFSVIEIK